MTDLASLQIQVDATQVKTGTAALDGLTAAGTRAQTATIGLGGAARGAAADATAMAAAAQAASRAAMLQATGFRASADAAKVNTLAMRETLVVARELSRGNFTRIPGSLTLLAQGVGSSGGVSSYLASLAQMLGLIKTVQNAELAEQATQAAAAASAVEGAVQRAASNVIAADTEVALSEAAIRTAETSTAEAAAQARLAAAHEAVAAAAAEATIAEDAFAVAAGRSAEASAASAAATRTLIGGTGIGLIGIGLVAGVAYGAIKRLQDQIKDDGTLTRFRDSLGLTHAEMLKLSDGVDKAGGKIKELTDVAPTFGDVMHGIFQEIAREANDGSAWDKFKLNASDAFGGVLDVWDKTSAALSAGMWTLGDIAKDVFQYIAQQIGQGFYDGVNKAIDAINSLNAKIPAWAGGGDPNLISHLAPDKRVADLGGLGATIKKQADQNYADALAANQRAYGGIRAGADASAESRMRDQANALIADRTPKKPKKESDHGLQEALDKLDAEIKGQYALAAAYQVSDVAAQRSIAHQKAAEDAISHKGGEDLFYAKELQKAVAEDVARQAKSNADLQIETSIRAQLNGQLADGTLNVAQYNDQLKLQTTLHRLNVDLENADAQHKGVVRDIIKQTIDLQGEQLQLEAQLNALKQISANDNEISKLQLEAQMIGASNKERAVALAQLEAMQQLKEIDPSGLLTRGERQDFVQSAINKAAAGVQTPFQQWAATVPQTAAAITDAIQGIETRGFDTLAQSIAGVATGTENLGQLFKDVSHEMVGDLVQVLVKMLEMRALSAAFGGLFGGGSAPSAADNMTMYGSSDGFSSFLNAKGNVFSRGNVIPFASGGVVGSPTLFPMSGGRAGVMGEAGPEAIMPLTRDASGRLGVRAANANQPPIEIHVLVDTSSDLEGKIVAISAQTVRAAAPIIVKAAVAGTMKTAMRPKLMGRVG